MKSVIGVAASVLGLLVSPGGAVASESAATDPDRVASETALGKAFAEGRFSVNLRYRLESVDDDAFAKDALASTLRSALSFETAGYRGLFAGVTIENVSAIGNDLLYNNAGAGSRNNGVTDRPVIADPEITELDHLYLGYRGPGGLEIKAGRFAYTLDNQRFIGIAPWRQNHRSYEGASVAFGSDRTLRASYAYLDRAYYNDGASPELAAHLFHLSRTFKAGAASAYAYLVDWQDESRDTRSSGTFGARFDGSAPLRGFDLLYLTEYARQTDYGDNPREFALDYAHLWIGARRGAWSVRVAWELKDGDGLSAVQTPLGTNHGQNGFADKLVVTPPDGSHDRYVRLAMDRERWSWLLSYHDFEAARGGAPLGTEIDFQGRFSPMPPLSLFLKIARYRAETLSTDTTKVMFWTSWTFDLVPGSRN